MFDFNVTWQLDCNFGSFINFEIYLDEQVNEPKQVDEPKQGGQDEEEDEEEEDEPEEAEKAGPQSAASQRLRSRITLQDSSIATVTIKDLSFF